MGKDGKKGLGMGLGALFGEEYPAPQPEREETAPDLLPIEKIEPRADQPRKHFDPEALEMLAESIRTYGLIFAVFDLLLDGIHQKAIFRSFLFCVCHVIVPFKKDTCLHRFNTTLL